MSGKKHKTEYTFFIKSLYPGVFILSVTYILLFTFVLKPAGMTTPFTSPQNKPRQLLYSSLFVGIISVACHFLSVYIGYRVVGFLLLVTVSLIAMFFDIIPVLLAAVLSALIWDFFFIPPHFTFQVGSAEDTILLLSYFIVAIVSSVLTYKIRRAEKAARQKEERANTIKLYNTLFNSLSHELRTPISAIIGATDNLQNNNDKLTPQNRNELISEIAKASFRLNGQVDNLLNMSRIETGHIQPNKDWCDISELIYHIADRIEENNIAQKINININPNIPLCKIDKGMLEQVLYNLENNAILYTKPGSVIDIIAACYTDVLEIRIEDEGPGLPEEEIEKVFDKFYRLKNSATGGTGLGLSIVKGFTEAMGGSIDLKNKTTGGAVFTVRIPTETSYLQNLKNE